MAEELHGSAILQVAAEIRELVAAGRDICNLTVGDFAPAQFPVPRLLSETTAHALLHGETNYPPAPGLPELRAEVARFYRDRLGLSFEASQILITAGARPSIYCAFRVLLDKGDRVAISVPCWNMDHYAFMTGAEPIIIECDATSSFLPTRSVLEDAVRGARLLTLNSPLNPSGTAFAADTLRDICQLVIEENKRRGPNERPLYLLYDQIYWLLTFHNIKHVDPITLCPEIAPYTILIDGISKHFAATGMRVGWAAGPDDIIAKMSDLNGHIGAWAPRAEQIGAIALLRAPGQVEAFHQEMIPDLQERLDTLYDGIQSMKEKGLPVDVFPAMGAIYLSARFALPDKSNEEIRSYLLHEAGFAMVPFQAFGVPHDTGWFRLSAGAVSIEQIRKVLPRLQRAIERAI